MFPKFQYHLIKNDCMKPTVLLLLVPIMFTCCNISREDSYRRFIPGAYIRRIDHEFAKGMDTLFVVWLGENTYRIDKRSGFQRLKDGKPSTQEYKKETWTASYDETSKTLVILSLQRVLMPMPDKKMLLLGSSEYIKTDL